MKKLLITSTALVATAGMAAADGHIALSGFAEMGISDAGGEVGFHTDTEFNVSMSGETDGGLSFGVSINSDEALSASADDEDDGGIAIFLSGGFGNVTLGDTDGALDWALTEVAMGTALTDDHTAHGGYSGNSALDGTYDGQVLRYDNTYGDFGVALSYEIDDAGAGDDVLGLGVKYNADLGGTTLGIGLGYQDNGTTDVVGVSLAAGFGAVDAVLNYWDAGAETYTAIGLGYTAGPLLVHVNYGEFDSGASGYGAVVNYDLGGGATLALGYGDTDGGDSTWSFGLSMGF